MGQNPGQPGQGQGQPQGQTGSGRPGQGAGQESGAQRNPGSDPNQERAANRDQQPGDPQRKNGPPEAGMADGGRPGQGEQNAASAAAGESGRGAAAGNSSQGNPSSNGASGASSPSSGKGNGPGTGQMSGGGGGRANQGGGGAGPESGATGIDPNAKDESKPTPPAAEAKDPFTNDDVAPANQAPTDLSLRGLSDVLKDAAKVKELEDRTGMSKEQIEMLARKYEKPKVGPGREAREVEVKIGEQAPAGPGSNLPVSPSRRINSTTIRNRGGIPVDKDRDNNEGIRNIPPAEWLRRNSEYHSTLAREQEKSSKKTAKPQPAGAT
jgi:hypothetical protein